MTKKIAILLLLITHSLTHSQAKKYVLNIYGTELKAQADWNSKTLLNLKTGDSVNVVNKTKIQTRKSILNDGLFLSDVWVQVKYNDITGYVFQGDFTNVKAKFRRDGSYDVHSLYGKKIFTYDSIRKVTYGNAEYEITDKYIQYKNGTEKSYDHDSCFFESFFTKKLTFNEVYHLSLFSYRTERRDKHGKIIINHPKFLRKKDGIYYFSDLAAIDQVIIEISEDGKITLSSDSCI